MVGTVTWDSNKDGKWNNGKSRTIKEKTKLEFEGPKPFQNKGGVITAASGNPRLIIDGHGVGTLECDGKKDKDGKPKKGMGRIYVDAVNYGSVLEYDLRFDDDIVDNHTCQTQSRHQEGGKPENKFGGVNYKIDRKNCGLKIETFHSKKGENHIEGAEHKLPKNIKVNDWVRVRLTTIPDEKKKTISSKMEIKWDKDFIKCIEHTYKNLEDYMVKKSDFEKRSYNWWRINTFKTGSISLRNIKQTPI